MRHCIFPENVYGTVLLTMSSSNEIVFDCVPRIRDIYIKDVQEKSSKAEPEGH